MSLSKHLLIKTKLVFKIKDSNQYFCINLDRNIGGIYRSSKNNFVFNLKFVLWKARMNGVCLMFRAQLRSKELSLHFKDEELIALKGLKNLRQLSVLLYRLAFTMGLWTLFSIPDEQWSIIEFFGISYHSNLDFSLSFSVPHRNSPFTPLKMI